MTQLILEADAPARKPTVFVANASGFVESHLIAALLERGFSVRASCPASQRADAYACISAQAGLPGASLELVAAGGHLASEWKRALGQSQYAIQCASTVARAQPGPAVATPEETLAMEALRLAARSKAVPCMEIGSSDSIAPARRAGTAAASAQGRAKPQRDLLSPVVAQARLHLQVPCVMGPLIHAEIPGSMKVLKRLLDGQVRRTPRLGYEVIDVRDVVAWMLDQLDGPEMAASPVILEGTFIWMEEIATLLRRRFPQFAHEFPQTQASDFYVLRHALFNAEVRRIVGALGKRPQHAAPALPPESEHYRTRLVGQTLIDAARSIILKGHLQSTAQRPSLASPARDRHG